MDFLNKLLGKKETTRRRSSSSRSASRDERKSAEQLLRFLEGRQVLYREMNEKCPRGVVRSARKIRSELRRICEQLAPDSELYPLTNNMRDAVREFLEAACQDRPHPKDCEDCTISNKGCARELLQLRRAVGAQIHALCMRFHLVPDARLQSILPTEDGHAPRCGISSKLLD